MTIERRMTMCASKATIARVYARMSKRRIAMCQTTSRGRLWLQKGSHCIVAVAKPDRLIA